MTHQISPTAKDAADANAESMTTKLVTLVALARMAGVARSTLYHWMLDGRVPPGVEVTEGPGNARYRVHVPTLNAWARARAKDPVSP